MQTAGFAGACRWIWADPTCDLDAKPLAKSVLLVGNCLGSGSHLCFFRRLELDGLPRFWIFAIALGGWRCLVGGGGRRRLCRQVPHFTPAARRDPVHQAFLGIWNLGVAATISVTGLFPATAATVGARKNVRSGSGYRSVRTRAPAEPCPDSVDADLGLRSLLALP